MMGNVVLKWGKNAVSLKDFLPPEAAFVDKMFYFICIISLCVLDWEAPGICIISYFDLEVSYNHGQLSVSRALHQRPTLIDDWSCSW